MSEENPFWDYSKAENSDDEEDNNDLQSRLYAEIYYQSGIEGEAETKDIPENGPLQLDTTVDESNIEPENMQYISKHKKAWKPGTIRGNSNKSREKTEESSDVLKEHQNQDVPLRKDSSIVEPSNCHNVLCIQSSVDSHESVEIQEISLTGQMESTAEASAQTTEDEATNQEIIENVELSDYTNPAIHKHNRRTTEKSSTKKGYSSKKQKSSEPTNYKHGDNSQKDNTVLINNSETYTKYNVLEKNTKQTMLTKQFDKTKEETDSDSEESICEVPVPPKPKPLLIDLPDSDEDVLSSGMEEDDLILRKWSNENASKNGNLKASTSASPELQIIEVHHKNTTSGNKHTDKSSSTKDSSINCDKSIRRTQVHEINQDIVLNCTGNRKVAENINGIKQLSGNVEQSHRDTSLDNVNRKSKRKPTENMSKENNENYITTIENRSSAKSRQNIDNDRSAKQNVRNLVYSNLSNDPITLYDNDNPAHRKRRIEDDSEVQDSCRQKKQYTIQQDNQNVQQGTSHGDSKGEPRDKYFKPISEELRDFYNDSRGQENFDISEIQKGMSKDPKMWKILDEDLMPRPNRRSKYWSRCTRCQRGDHVYYNCPEPRKSPRCYMCGVQGHTENRCPQKICLTCGKKQSTFRKTCEICRTLYCTMCSSVGHKSTQCPDLWRRFHHTTDSNQLPQDLDNVMKPASSLYCCNCTKRGHESSTCNKYRWSQHFPTPAIVTNYTDGPTYAPEADHSLEFSTEAGTSSLGGRNNKELTSQGSKEMWETEYLEPSAKYRQIAKYSTLSMTKPAYRIYKNRTKLVFTDIIYFCGMFDQKMKVVRLRTRNLSKSKDFHLDSLIKRKAAPIFLEKLSTLMEFEVTIGWTTSQPGLLMLQIIAVKGCVTRISTLVRNWLSLPEDEKNYGINADLSINPTIMLNLLNSKQVELAEKDPIDPRSLFHNIRNLKAELENLKETGSEKYYQIRTHLLRSQTKLLRIISTEPEPDKNVRKLPEIINALKTKSKNRVTNLDYLKYVLLYNDLFVPHTPTNLYERIDKVLTHRLNENNTNCLKEEQLKSKKKAECKQGNLTSTTNPNSSSFPAAFCIPKDINSVENANQVTPFENQNINHISPGTSSETDIFEIYDFGRNSTDITSINVQQIKLISCDTAENNEEQLSTSYVKNDPDIFMDQQLHKKSMSGSARKKLKRIKMELKTDIGNECDTSTNATDPSKYYNNQLYAKATKLLKKALVFQLPYMKNAAKEFQKKIDTQTIRQKHINSLRRLIKIEMQHQKNINSYCNYFQ